MIDALPVIGQSRGFVMHDTPMPDRQIEWFCSSESQQWEIDCNGVDLLIVQSTSYMPLPSDVDMLSGQVENTHTILVLHGPKDVVDAYGAELADMVRLAEIAHVLSTFRSLMYDLLVLRFDIATAMGVFTVEVVSHAMTNIGIEHMGALQVIT